MTGIASVIAQRSAVMAHWPRFWLLLLGLVCALELVTHAGSRNGFLQSSRPEFSPNDLLPADGYVSWVGDVPVLHDADGILTLVSLFLGERGPAETGILDRRAAYAYLASLAVPVAGPYAGFMAINLLFWWGAAAAAFWLVRRRWGDPALACAVSLLIATGHGFLFMAGVPMSYLAAYASVILVLALAEWLGAFTPRTRLQHWLLLGWAAGVASTIYFAHLPILVIWWAFGLRRVPWRYLAAGTCVALAISFSWEACGRSLVGLGFTTDNSAAVGDSITSWLRHVGDPWPVLLAQMRAATVRGTLVGAFPYPWWALVVVGLVVSARQDREWSLGLIMGGLLPAVVIVSLLPLPRAAYYMYPAVTFLAARGALGIGALVRGALSPLGGMAPVAGWLATAAAVGLLIVISNIDLLGYQWVNVRFHFSAGHAW